MALFKFNYKKISYLNTFNGMTKEKYLSYKDKSSKFRYVFSNKSLNCRFKPITVKEMPVENSSINVEDYPLNCKDNNCLYYSG
jgi:hypothetical protein